MPVARPSHVGGVVHRPQARTATTRAVAQVNQSVLIGALRERGPMTLNQLRSATGLSPATVNRLVDRLRQDGVVVTAGVEASTGGRPPQLLAFNPRQYSVVGLDVGGTTITGAVFDLAGEVLAEESTPTHPDGGPGTRAGQEGMDVFERIVQVTDRLVARAEAVKCPVRAIGAGVPGAVRTDSDVVQFAPSLGWWDMPLSRLLAERTRLPVVVENDVNLIAVSEHRRGAGRGTDDLLVVALGTGVGAALVLDGRVYRGHQGGAGEIGYFLLDREALASEWRGFGDFETRVGELRQRIVAGGRTFEEFLAEPSTESAAVLDELAGMTCLVCANAASLLNPRRVVLGGALGRSLGAALIPLITARLRNRVPWQPEFAVARLDRAELLGAGQLATELVAGQLGDTW